MVCSTEQRQCVECVDDSTCPKSKPRCRVALGQCVHCRSNDDCGLDGLIFAWDTHMGWIDACWQWPALWEARYIVIRAVATGMRPGTLYLDSMVLDPQRCPPPSG